MRLSSVVAGRHCQMIDQDGIGEATARAGAGRLGWQPGRSAHPIFRLPRRQFLAAAGCAGRKNLVPGSPL